jgi:hypothetical protein
VQLKLKLESEQEPAPALGLAWQSDVWWRQRLDLPVGWMKRHWLAWWWRLAWLGLCECGVSAMSTERQWWKLILQKRKQF